jgi:hypothetical protein
MSELNEVKTLLLELAKRVSALETIVRSTSTVSSSSDTTAFGVSRIEEPITQLVILGRRGENCLCGIRTNKKDKHIPVIELNLFNLKTFTISLEKALREGHNTVKLENYKQHTDYAYYNRGSWELVS